MEHSKHSVVKPTYLEFVATKAGKTTNAGKASRKQPKKQRTSNASQLSTTTKASTIFGVHSSLYFLFRINGFTCKQNKAKRTKPSM